MSKVITVTGPSGSGKDSIVDALLFILGEKSYSELTPFVKSHYNALAHINVPDRLRRKPYLRELISHTTRPMRVGEENGKDYFFITKKVFDSIKKVEETCYAGNYYCLSQDAIENNKANVGIVIVDINGKKAIQDFVGEENIFSIFLNVPRDDIEMRMRIRGDKEEDIQKRLKNAVENKEFENSSNCKYIIDNVDFVGAVQKALNILNSI